MKSIGFLLHQRATIIAHLCETWNDPDDQYTDDKDNLMHDLWEIMPLHERNEIWSLSIALEWLTHSGDDDWRERWNRSPKQKVS